MKITRDTLPSMQDGNIFLSVFADFSVEVLSEARLFPRLSKLRILEAHSAWTIDLKSLGQTEPHLYDGLDHFKHAGHLAFWLRRTTPVVEAHDNLANLGDSQGYPITNDEQALRDLLFGYCNEYLAFDLGYQICRFYEINKEGASDRAKTIVLSEDYIRSMCHFLKYKTVSPHALYLIYKSIFEGF